MEDLTSREEKSSESKSQKRADRQRRRAERRILRQQDIGNVQIRTLENEYPQETLQAFIAEYGPRIKTWFRHYLILWCKADDAAVPYIKNMTREQRNEFIQEYVDVSEFLDRFERYLSKTEAGR